MKAYIITSAKYEECYIEEWVQYHLNMGFDKIIINDNNPKDYPYNPKNILKKYIDNGQVIVERYYDTNIKDDFDEVLLPIIYIWLYKKYKNECDWCAKLDIDEYLNIPETNNNIKSFLEQNKFNNALSIIIPMVNYSIKNKFKTYYTRLKSTKNRFEYNNDSYFWIGHKSIFKSSELTYYIGHHFIEILEHENNAEVIKKYNNYILYMLPNGEDAKKYYISIDNEKANNMIYENINTWNYISEKICCINHYNDKSIEERINKYLKFEFDKGHTNYLHDDYLNLKNKYSTFFNKPRDLYKLYFIDNINHIS